MRILPFHKALLAAFALLSVGVAAPLAAKAPAATTARSVAAAAWIGPLAGGGVLD